MPAPATYVNPADGMARAVAVDPATGDAVPAEPARVYCDHGCTLYYQAVPGRRLMWRTPGGELLAARGVRATRRGKVWSLPNPFH